LHFAALTAVRKNGFSSGNRVSKRLLKRGNSFFAPPISLSRYGFLFCKDVSMSDKNYFPKQELLIGNNIKKERRMNRKNIVFSMFKHTFHTPFCRSVNNFSWGAMDE
jgi:hypothetical protein